MEFREAFDNFLENSPRIKTVFAASASLDGRPHSAPKVLIETRAPDRVYFIDYLSTQTCRNLKENSRLSLSIMDERQFTGFRLFGTASILRHGPVFEHLREKWQSRAVSLEAERMLDRIRGLFSAREAEMALPEDFVIVEFTAERAELIHSAGHNLDVAEQHTLRHTTGPWSASRTRREKTLDTMRPGVRKIPWMPWVCLAGGILLSTLRLEIGLDLRFTPIYLMLVFLTTLYASKRAGMLISVLFAVSIPVLHLCHPDHVVSESVWWNALMRLGSCLMVVMFVVLIEHEMKRARFDDLTGLVTRRRLQELCDAEIVRLQRYKHPFSFALLDCDDFKQVNDRWGHAAGDKLLREIGENLSSTLRIVDVASRIGGDEFALLLPETGPEGARVVISKVREKLSRITLHNGENPTFSIGAVTFLNAPQNFEEVMRLCDEKMYEVKRSGKNAVNFDSH